MSKDSGILEILRQMFPQLQPAHLESLAAYYDLSIKWNRRISLTTITEPREFAERHIGEALFAASCLKPSITDFWDVGSGLGIPGVPVAIVRPDLGVHLIESSRKKSIFLEEAAYALGLDNVKVLNCRFETLDGFSESDCIAARAVEKMTEVVRLVVGKGETTGQLLIYGGANLKPGKPTGKEIKSHRLDGSDERYLFEIA